MIDKKVSTSPILGTLCSVNLLKNNPQAIRGRAAFFEPDISTVPDKSWGHWIESMNTNN
jgi:hypothetical protein